MGFLFSIMVELKRWGVHHTMPAADDGMLCYAQ